MFKTLVQGAGGECNLIRHTHTHLHFLRDLVCALFSFDRLSQSTVLILEADSGIVMVDGTFFGDSSEQNRSWEDCGITISGIKGTHQNSTGVRMPVLIVVPQVNSKLGPF